MLRPYRTIQKPSENEFVIQRSRFLGRAFPVTSEEEVNSLLLSIRKQHYDATHNCYAYSLGVQGELARFSDDGEPGGTAGLPMMEALRHKGVTDVLVVATRYFGGILLGAGGLVRAYSRTASEALSAAGLLEMEPGIQAECTLDYALYGSLESFFRERAGELSADYAECVRLRMVIAGTEAERFRKDLIERSNGRVTPEFTGEVYRKKRLP